MHDKITNVLQSPSSIVLTELPRGRKELYKISNSPRVNCATTKDEIAEGQMMKCARHFPATAERILQRGSAGIHSDVVGAFVIDLGRKSE